MINAFACLIQYYWRKTICFPTSLSLVRVSMISYTFYCFMELTTLYTIASFFVFFLNAQDEDAKVKRAFQTLLTYIGNVAKNPNEEKFRKIRLTNPSFQVRDFRDGCYYHHVQHHFWHLSLHYTLW